MNDKKNDFFKSFDPNELLKLQGLNVTKMLKQLEKLKLSGFLEKLEDLNKLMKQMEEMKFSDLVKRMEEIKLSSILKQVEDNKFPELLDKLPNPLKAMQNGMLDLDGSVKNVTIQHTQDSIPDQIKKLAELRELGIINNDEFQAKKKQLLERL